MVILYSRWRYNENFLKYRHFIANGGIKNEQITRIISFYSRCISMGVSPSLFYNISNVTEDIMLNFEVFLLELEVIIRDSNKFIKLIYATGVIGLMPIVLRGVFS